MEMKNNNEYVLMIHFKCFDSEETTIIEYDNGSQFTLEVLDFGSFLFLFRSINNMNVFRGILGDLAIPGLCDEITVMVCDENIKSKRKTYEEFYNRHSNWLNINTDQWDNELRKWKANIITVVGEFKKMNVDFRKYSCDELNIHIQQTRTTNK